VTRVPACARPSVSREERQDYLTALGGPQQTDLSVVVCSLNGARRMPRCLQALASQTVSSAIEVIVVDDGSADRTSEVAREHGAKVVRHATTRGPAAARNTGVRHASGPTIAFLDDDCEPTPTWAERILAGYQEGVAGVGGAIVPQPGRGFMPGYLRRHNPLKPLELSLAESQSLAYRLRLYLKASWSRSDQGTQREVYGFPSANMSLLRSVFDEVRGFDERFKFGGEDTDLCMRVARALPHSALVFVPEASVTHHFELTLRDTFRRSLAYGEGAARLCRKWPGVLPAAFPGPFIVLALLLLAIWLPMLLIVAVIFLFLLYPLGLSYTVRDHSLASLFDPFMQLGQETCTTAGFVLGWWPARHVFSGRGASEDG
jgi:glycosyltransferase involved in cell wall biosynthesis